MYKRKSNDENSQPKRGRANDDAHCCTCNCKALIDSISKKLDGVVELQNRNFENIMEMLAGNTALLKSLVRLKDDEASISALFPIQDENGLKTLNEQINEENRIVYVKGMKLMMRGNPKKKILSILTKDFIIKLNLDGIHGKLRLKDYTNFYSALEDAICEESDDPEKTIRLALKAVKKLYFHSECLKKKQLTPSPSTSSLSSSTSTLSSPSSSAHA